jgi:hypothetical protein
VTSAASAERRGLWFTKRRVTVARSTEAAAAAAAAATLPAPLAELLWLRERLLLLLRAPAELPEAEAAPCSAFTLAPAASSASPMSRLSSQRLG